jgi:hypothetical protein
LVDSNGSNIYYKGIGKFGLLREKELGILSQPTAFDHFSLLVALEEEFFNWKKSKIFVYLCFGYHNATN